jgi:uncharacterized membrane protein
VHGARTVEVLRRHTSESRCLHSTWKYRDSEFTQVGLLVLVGLAELLLVVVVVVVVVVLLSCCSCRRNRSQNEKRMNRDNTFAVLATTQATRGADQGPNHKHVAGYHARPQGPQAGSQFDLANCSSSVYIGEEMDICARAYDGPYINVGRHELEASCSTHLV